jgi:transcriptional regulator with XRE-family HTH domain
MDAQNTTVRSRELGDELRRVRKYRGLTAAQLAHEIGWSESKVSRVETGKTGCSEVEAAIFLARCGVLRRELDRIIALCRGDEKGAWLRDHGARLPDELHRLALHETTADLIEQVELNRVPGLLQTEDYARDIIGSIGLLPERAVAPRVRARMERQSLVKRRNPPNFAFYIQQSALELPVSSARAMHEQMLHLLLMSQHRWCSIQIIPTSVGAHAGLGGPFSMMRYEDHPPVTCVELESRSLFLESSQDIALHRLIIGRLADVALSREESRSVLAALASEYDRAEAGIHGDGVA